MELKKLRTLAEAKVRAEIEARRMFDSMEGSLGSIEFWISTSRLADFLAKHNFPATESKAFEAAFKKLYNEFHDLKQSIITGVEEREETKKSPVHWNGRA